MSFSIIMMFHMITTQVNTLLIDVNIRCCHVGYEYNSTDGVCVFTNDNDVIIRQDQSNKYIYVRVSFIS